MDRWRDLLTFDPISTFVSKGNIAIQYFVERDLLNLEVDTIQSLWNLPEPQKILKKQLPDGSWPRTDKKQHPAVKHQLFDTWRAVNELVGKFGFSREHPQLAQAVEYLFSCQTEDGDFRGILANHGHLLHWRNPGYYRRGWI
jgi:hypothetical protein